MRTIKFRGKCAKDSRYAGEWVDGGVLQCEKSDDVLIVSAITDTCSCTYHVDPATVGQFTGLHDKHGMPIYEGDIVKWLHVRSATTSVMEPPEDYIERCMDVVVFGAGAFTVEEEMYPDMAFLCKECHYNETDSFTWVCNLDDFPGITTDDMCICEVIGNIHDSPDLIEKGGEQ